MAGQSFPIGPAVWAGVAIGLCKKRAKEFLRFGWQVCGNYSAVFLAKRISVSAE
jgi:hypothetical protein